MTEKIITNPPEWLLSRDYSKTYQYNQENWFYHLFTRLIFERLLDNEGYKRDIDRDEEWRTQLEHTDPSLKESIAWTGRFSSVRELPISPESSPTPPQSSYLVEIDLDSPDGVIVRQFKSWLTEKRRSHPCPVKKPGKRKPENILIDEKHMSTWGAQKILQLYDLILWRKLFEIDATNRQLIDWIFSDIGDSDQKDIYDHAHNTLQAALDTLNSLPFQLDDVRK